MKFYNAIIPLINTLIGRFVLMSVLTFSQSVVALAADTTITLSLEDNKPAIVAPGETGLPSSIQIEPTSAKPAKAPVVNGVSAVLMDMETGQVLYAKAPHSRRPPASTTKIMTGILIIEHCKMDDTISASKKASETPFTSLHLKPGEKISVLDLLTGMIVRSANDAAVAAAEHIAGSVPKFAVMMNRKAAEIGCKNTHFVTPNGLYDKNHYSSAYDMCLMARYGLKYSLFNNVVNTRKYTLASRTLNKADLVVFAKSKFLKNYPGADGIKSGYTKESKSCYVGSATRYGWRLVSTVLGSENSANDTTTLMDYGFANFKSVEVASSHSEGIKVRVKGGSSDSVAAVPAHDLRVVVPKTGAQITTQIEMSEPVAPIIKGAKVGKLYASVNGSRVAEVDLKALEDVDVSIARRALEVTKVCGILAAFLFIGGKYGTTLTKGSRSSRRRISTIL